MRKKNSPLPALIGGTVIVAVLCTLTIKGGWLIWIPVVMAFCAVSVLGKSLGR